MNNIENVYSDYDELLREFGEDTIRERFEQILTEMRKFIEETEMQEVAVINEMALTHALMDYFSDVFRLKAYQKIAHVNEVKIKAYETYWLIQRKPIQLIKELDDDKMLYINEKFVLSRLVPFILGKKAYEPMEKESAHAFENFLNTFYYFLKFRRCDAQAIELMLLAFKAGTLFAD